jgi:hypothetical protein
MGRSKVIFNLSTNNLGRIRQGNDGISGFLRFASVPAEFGTDNVKLIGSVKEAETLGITALAYKELHYHISEYFRIAGNSSLYVGIFNNSGSAGYTFDEILFMQRIALGQMSQLGVYLTEDLTTGLVNTLHAKKIAMDALLTPCQIILTANVVGVTLPDFSAATTYGVSISNDQSGQGRGATIAASNGKTIGSVGAALGAVSLVSVQRSIGSVEFVQNLAGSELDVIADGKGNLYTSLSNAQVDAEIAKGYLKLIKHPGLSGTYFNDDSVCAGSGDLNNIHLNRVINKAIKGVAAALAGKLNGDIILNADGTIATVSAKSFESIAGVPLDLMRSLNEVSDYSVYVNPDQNILGTDNLNVEIKIVPTGTAKTITVNIGFVRSL